MTITMMFCNSFVSLYDGLITSATLVISVIYFFTAFTLSARTFGSALTEKKTCISTTIVNKSPWDTWCNELSDFYHWSLKKITAILSSQTIPPSHQIQCWKSGEIAGTSLHHGMWGGVGGEVRQVKLYSRLVCVCKGAESANLSPDFCPWL